MTAIDIAEHWARYFGLASAPLFHDEKEQGAYHHVLLDGGFGSFALSATDEADWDSAQGAEWAWSSDLAHHVAVTPSHVTVIRWDKPSPERFTLQSVEGKLDAFYGYLTSDRVRSTRGVVDHLISIFRRTRSLVNERGLDDVQSVDAYLSVLSAAMERAGFATPNLTDSTQGTVEALTGRAFDHLVADALAGEKSGLPLPLHPQLAVRHAGSEIFQEAHFALASASTVDMFDYVGASTAKKVTRGSSHFTPPALARSICEQALQHLEDLKSRTNLVVLDPACGSGSFLYETQRALRRTGFTGKLKLVGRDLSPAALSMARFTLEFGANDWTPQGGLEIELGVGDSLTAELPAADLILMNPPFLSWNAMGREQRSTVERVFGSGVARGDLSMAFVSRALGVLNQGGTLGSVLPASVMTLSGAEKWRNSLLEQGELRFIGSLGEYGLFTHAMVNVGALVLQKSTKTAEEEESATVVAALAGNRPEATGDALRAVRRRASEVFGSSDWQVFEVSAAEFAERPTWRLIPPRASAALRRLADSGLTRPIGELFAIRQGVRTGNNSVFVLPQHAWRALPARERKWFRPAAMGDNLNNGVLSDNEFVFYPYGEDELHVETEDDLRVKLPTYYKLFLLPSKQKLVMRANITRSNRQDWWGLSERRAWGSSRQPRIVSKYFGAVGSFALDAEAKFVVVQGFAWFPILQLASEDFDDVGASEINDQISPTDLLAAYVAIFNSAPFHRLVSLLSSHVAGGQFDLSPRFMNAVPVPDIAAASADETLGSRVLRLISLGQHPRPDERDWAALVSRIVVDLYGAELFEQIGYDAD